MRVYFCLFLLPFSPMALRAAAELHVSRVGDAPEFVGLRLAESQTTLRLEAFPDHVMPATLLAEGRNARLFGEPAEIGQPTKELGDLTLPAGGRHLLLVTQVGERHARTKILPFDESTLPVGGVLFLNLTTRRMRCSIDAESVELIPDEAKRLSTIVSSRRIVSHRLELKNKDGWKTDSSTTLILSANRRFIFVLQEDSPHSPLRRALVTDFDPVRNLAPLAPLVKVEPPLPDPPTK